MTAIAPADHAAYLDWLRAQLDQAIIPLDDAAWNRAAAQDSIDSYRAYLAEFPRGRHSGDANEVSCRLEADRAAWIRVKTANRIADFEAYLTAQPSGKYREEARKTIDQLIQADDQAWQKTRKRHSLPAYRDYLKAFPDALHRTEAYEQAWASALKSDSASGYKNFTIWFMHAPQQAQAQKARKRLEHDQVAWDTAVQANSIVGYANYLKTQIDGKFRADAQGACDRLTEGDSQAWKHATDQDSITGYSDYLKSFPDALHSADAYTKAWVSAQKQDSLSGYIDYLSRFPDTPHCADAQQIAAGFELDQTAWDEATRANSLDAYDAYLKTHTDGRFRAAAQAAFDRLKQAELHRAEACDTAWKAAKARDSLSAYVEYREKCPGTPHQTEVQQHIAALQSDQMIRVFEGVVGGGKITHIAFSPDGQRLLSAGPGAVRLWDRQTGRLIHTFPGRIGDAVAIAFSPDGRRVLFAGSCEGSHFCVWDCDTGAIIRCFSQEGKAIAVSPDARLAVSEIGNYNEHQLLLWDVASGQVTKALVGHSDTAITDAVVSNYVVASAFSANGRRFLSADGACFMRLWDVTSGEVIQTLKQPDRVAFLDISPDGRLALANLANDINKIHLIDLDSGQYLHSLESSGGYFKCATWSADGVYIAQGLFRGNNSDLVQIWDTRSGQVVSSCHCRADALAFSPDGRQVVSGAEDGQIILWDLQTSQPVMKLRGLQRGHAGPVTAVAISPDGRRALSSSSDETLRLWDLETGDLVLLLMGHHSKVHTVAFSPNGHHALSADYSKTLHLWDLETGAIVSRFKVPYTHSILSVAFSIDGRRACSLHSKWNYEKPCGYVWDLSTGEIIRHIEECDTRDPNELFSSKERCPGVMAMAVNERPVKVDWNSAGWARKLPRAVGDFRLQDVQSGDVFRTFSGHIGQINTLTISPDGHYALTGGEDTTIRYWCLDRPEIGQDFDEVAWTRATAQHSISMYEHFLRYHPNSNHRTEAMDALRRLSHEFPVLRIHGRFRTEAIEAADVAEWVEAQKQDSPNGYAGYLYSNPNGRHRDEAIRERDQRLRQMQEERTWRQWGRTWGPSFSQKWDELTRAWVARKIPRCKYIPTYSLVDPNEDWTDDGNDVDGNCQRRTSEDFAIDPGRRFLVSIHLEQGLWSLWFWNFAASERPRRITSWGALAQNHLCFVPRYAPGPRVLLKNYWGLKLWDLNTGTLAHVFDGHSNGISRFTLSPDGRHLLTGGYDGTLRLWDLDFGLTLRIFEGHSQHITSAVISPDGRHILSSAYDDPLRLWSIDTGKTVRTFEKHEGSVSWVAFTPDGRHGLSLLERDNTCRLLDLETGKTIRLLDTSEMLRFHEIIQRCMRET